MPFFCHGTQECHFSYLSPANFFSLPPIERERKGEKKKNVSPFGERKVYIFLSFGAFYIYLLLLLFHCFSCTRSNFFSPFQRKIAANSALLSQMPTDVGSLRMNLASTLMLSLTNLFSEGRSKI